MTQTFTANGKLLLTGEYLVMHGALALAIPLRLGQSMTVDPLPPGQNLIRWNAYTPQGHWFSAALKRDSLSLIHTDDPSKAEKLASILKEIRNLNPSAIHHDLAFETHLDFNPSWGLGSSSTLISNLARWADVNPYTLLNNTIGGSGYDIACAIATNPIYYRLETNQPVVAQAYFNPPFANQLFFVYQGKKQHSSNEVTAFNARARYQDLHVAIEKVTDISRKLPTVKNINIFCDLIRQHETVVSQCLGREPVQNQFPGFEGTLKSLGAWGGDFILAATTWPQDKVREYFLRKGLDVVFNYNDIVYH